MAKTLADYGITRHAVSSGLIRIACVNPRDFAEDVRQSVDDRPFGGGPGMVMKFGPLKKAIRTAKRDLNEAKVLYMTPQGRPLDQKGVQELSQAHSLIVVAGRYEGIDERLIEQEIDEEWSIGDYVISGGELAAMVLIDAVSRQLPGVLGNELSAGRDSFAHGLLDHPQYTRPEMTTDGNKVPEILLSGDHQRIDRWRLQQSLGRTWLKRPDLLKGRKLTTEQEELLEKFKIAFTGSKIS